MLDAEWTSIRRHWPLPFVCNTHRLRTTNNWPNPFPLSENVHPLIRDERRTTMNDHERTENSQKKRHGRVESKRILINSTSSSYSSNVSASVKPVFRLMESLRWAKMRMNKRGMIMAETSSRKRHWLAPLVMILRILSHSKRITMNLKRKRSNTRKNGLRIDKWNHDVTCAFGNW